MFLLDTDVLSSLRKRQRHPRTVQWIASQMGSDLFLSAVTIGEIERGIERERGNQPQFAMALETWLNQILGSYGNRILPFDVPAARRWGQLSAALGNAAPDLMIAATALERGFCVVTHNDRHFRPTGVRIVNPS